MLIVNSANAPRLVAGNKREKHENEIREWVADQTKNAIYLQDNDLSPANAARQLGKPMTPEALETQLKKLEPRLIFEYNFFNPTKKYLYCFRGGEKVSICPYENGVMPEHSIIKVKEEIVRDMSVGTIGGTPIERKDLPKHEWTPDGFVFDGVRPGWKKVQVPWGEAIRGWRTVLIRLVEKQILTPTQVEATFGIDNTPNWAMHMGKQNDIRLPW